MPLIDALADPSSGGVEELLSEKVRFRSPYADYAGRADVAHLLGLIRGVLVDVKPVRRLHEQTATITLFEAHVAEQNVQGMLFEQHDDAGRLVDATLTIRPYAGLRAAMKSMQALMADLPLPSVPARPAPTPRPIMALFDLASRRWTLRVLWELSEAGAPLTFRELRTRCADMSSSVLSRRVAELREARLVIRESDGYGLSELGEGLVTSMQPLLAWSRTWATELEHAVDELGPATPRSVRGGRPPRSA